MCVSARPAESAARSQTSTGTHAKSTECNACMPTTGGQPTMAAGQRAGGWPSSLLYLGPGTTSVLVLVWVCFGRCSRRWHCGTARPRVGYTRCCPDSRSTADCYQRRLKSCDGEGRERGFGAVLYPQSGGKGVVAPVSLIQRGRSPRRRHSLQRRRRRTIFPFD